MATNVLSAESLIFLFFNPHQFASQSILNPPCLSKFPPKKTCHISVSRNFPMNLLESSMSIQVHSYPRVNVYVWKITIFNGYIHKWAMASTVTLPIWVPKNLTFLPTPTQRPRCPPSHTLFTKPHAVAATNQHGAFRRRDSTSVLSGQI